MLQIEYAVIGSLMLWRIELFQYLAHISAESLGTPVLKNIFLEMQKQDTDADLTLILAELEANEKTVLITAVETYACSLANFNSYLIKLKEHSISRRLKQQLYQIIVADNVLLNANMLSDIASQEGDNKYLASYKQKAKDTQIGRAHV